MKQLLGCRHLLSTKPGGVEIQMYLAIIACLLILIYTGAHHQPKRTGPLRSDLNNSHVANHVARQPGLQHSRADPRPPEHGPRTRRNPGARRPPYRQNPRLARTANDVSIAPAAATPRRSFLTQNFAQGNFSGPMTHKNLPKRRQSKSLHSRVVGFVGCPSRCC